MARKRGAETIGDIVRSLVVVLIPVAFIAGLVGLLRPSSETIRDVDWEAALESARATADYQLLGPDSIPDGWTATRVAYEPGASPSEGAWRMNFVTDHSTYVGLVQRPGALDPIVREELGEMQPDGESVVDGETWRRYLEQGAQDPDRALVAERSDSVVIVLGSGDYPELEAFAESLR